MPTTPPHTRRHRAPRIMLVDNNDSFTRNLEHLVAVECGVAPSIVPYADFDPVKAAAHDVVILSPGPGHPGDYPAYRDFIPPDEDQKHSLPGALDTPVLGVCLGMQVINNCLGGTTEQLPGCVHGRVDDIVLDGRSLQVARYHSLYCATVAPSLTVTSSNSRGVPMAVQHATRRLIGYQFHPESFLTQDGAWCIRHALARFFPL